MSDVNDPQMLVKERGSSEGSPKTHWKVGLGKLGMPVALAMSAGGCWPAAKLRTFGESLGAAAAEELARAGIRRRLG